MPTVKNLLNRRQLLAKTARFSTLYALTQSVPGLAFVAESKSDPRVAAIPIADRGFASVRKIGDGVYATIANPGKGLQATCNGGIIVGKDAALLIEGFNSPAGAQFQMDALRTISNVPVQAAFLSHYHYDHSMGNAFYGGASVPVWAHADCAQRIVDNYVPMQAADKARVLGPFTQRVHNARTDLERAHAQTDVVAMTEVFTSVTASQIGLPNHPLDPAKLPISVDLGGVTAVLEFYRGHSGTDIVVSIPEQNVVFAGDLLFNGKYPVCFDPQVTISGWRKTLNKFAALGKDTLFVPGHGQVCGQECIAAQLEIFDDISLQALRMHGAGIPIEEAQHRYIIPDRFKLLPLWSWHFTVGSAIVNCYAELAKIEICS